jgi:hypothetical protein
MEDASFIIGSWVLTFIAVGTYAAFVIRRGRELSRHATSEEMPWT